jgi:hypothetical protein
MAKRPPDPRPRSALAAAAALVAGAATLWGVIAGARALEPREPEVGARIAADFRTRARKLAEARVTRIAFLGDSTVLSFPDQRTLDQAVERELRARSARPVAVGSFALLGMNLSDHYFLAEPILAAGPELVVLPVNLAVFGTDWRRWRRPWLAGWLPPARLGEAAVLPLDWAGLTFDRVLLYGLLVRSGLAPAWQRLRVEQARVVNATASLRRSADGTDLRGAGPLPAGPADRLERAESLAIGGRPSRAFIQARYGSVLEGLARDARGLAFLTAAVAAYARAGAVPLVYAVPMNGADLTRQGVAWKEGVAASLGAIRRAALRGGGVFLDLHDLLPDREFRDASGHHTVEGRERLARALADAIDSHRRAPRGGSR